MYQFAVFLCGKCFYELVCNKLLIQLTAVFLNLFVIKLFIVNHIYKNENGIMKQPAPPPDLF